MLARIADGREIIHSIINQTIGCLQVSCHARSLAFMLISNTWPLQERSTESRHLPIRVDGYRISVHRESSSRKKQIFKSNTLAHVLAESNLGDSERSSSIGSPSVEGLLLALDIDSERTADCVLLHQTTRWLRWQAGILIRYFRKEWQLKRAAGVVSSKWSMQYADPSCLYLYPLLKVLLCEFSQ